MLHHHERDHFLDAVQVGDAMRRKLFSISIPAELCDALDEIAEQLNISRSRLVENIILKYMETDEGGNDHGKEE